MPSCGPVDANPEIWGMLHGSPCLTPPQPQSSPPPNPAGGTELLQGSLRHAPRNRQRRRQKKSQDMAGSRTHQLRCLWEFFPEALLALSWLGGICSPRLSWASWSLGSITRLCLEQGVRASQETTHCFDLGLAWLVRLCLDWESHQSCEG